MGVYVIHIISYHHIHIISYHHIHIISYHHIHIISYHLYQIILNSLFKRAVLCFAPILSKHKNNTYISKLYIKYGAIIIKFFLSFFFFFFCKLGIYKYFIIINTWLSFWTKVILYSNIVLIARLQVMFLSDCDVLKLLLSASQNLSVIPSSTYAVSTSEIPLRRGMTGTNQWQHK